LQAQFFTPIRQTFVLMSDDPFYGLMGKTNTLVSIFFWRQHHER
jgi:hypothetical protein